MPLMRIQKKLRLRWLAALLLIGLSGAPAWAHIGPPYPIMQNRKIGPFNVEVWSNPDVGVGSFFVVIDPPPGQSIPPDLKVQVAVQPVTHRLPEKTYDAWREKLKSRIEFKTIAPFDKEEMWHVRVILASEPVVQVVAAADPGRGCYETLTLALALLRLSRRR